MLSADLSAQYDKIYKYCYFKTGSTALAEDLTQETFLRFYKSSSYTENGKIMAYLYTIASNLCADSFRRMKTEPIGEGADEQDDMDLALVVRQAVDSLDRDEREVIVLMIINGQTAAETADIMGISRFAVYRKEKKALKRLKEILGDDFYG